MYFSSNCLQVASPPKMLAALRNFPYGQFKFTAQPYFPLQWGRTMIARCHATRGTFAASVTSVASFDVQDQCAQCFSIVPKCRYFETCCGEIIFFGLKHCSLIWRFWNVCQKQRACTPEHLVILQYRAGSFARKDRWCGWRGRLLFYSVAVAARCTTTACPARRTKIGQLPERSLTRWAVASLDQASAFSDGLSRFGVCLAAENWRHILRRSSRRQEKCWLQSNPCLRATLIIDPVVWRTAIGCWGLPVCVGWTCPRRATLD